MADVPVREPQNAEPQKKERPPLTAIKDLGICADRNARHRRTMEDCHTFKDGFMDDPNCAYFGIYDGHGGKTAAEYVRDHLHVNFEEALKAKPDNPQEAWTESYLTTDNGIGEANIQFAGTTCVSSLLRVESSGEKKLYTANCGDARAVLARGGKGFRLSFDHKATDEEEIKRIQAAGGFVVMGRVNGMLAVARSLGDRAMKDYVSGEPYLSETTITEEDTHLILACDGVWDVIDDDAAVEIVSKCEKMQEAAKKLLIAALQAGSTDNISVMVAKL